MTVLGRGISGLEMQTNAIMVGVAGVIGELPPGDIGKVLTIDPSGNVNWEDSQGGGGGSITGATNLAGGGAGVFAQDNAGILEFKTIAAGAGISISQNANEVIVTNTGGAAVLSVNGETGIVVLDIEDINDVANPLAPTLNDVLTFDGFEWVASAPPGAGGGEANDGVNLGTGIELFAQKVGVDLQFRSIDTLGNISVTQTATSIVIDSSGLDGTVTSMDVIDSSGGLDFSIGGGPITTSGTINMELATIASVSGVYASPVNVTVDTKGRITAISSSGGPTVDVFKTIIGDASVAVASGETDSIKIMGDETDGDITTAVTTGPNELRIGLTPTGVTPGSFNFASVTVDARGRVTAISTNTALQNVVEDTSPSLGGNLDVTNFDLFTTSGNLVLDPQAGSFIVGPDLYDMSSGTDESLATKKYVDDSIVASPIQDLYELFAGDSGITPAPSTPNDTLTFAGAGGITTDVSGATVTITSSAMLDLVDDLAPQLGGALDVNGNNIVTTAAADLILFPDTTGLVIAHGAYDMSAGVDHAFATKGYVDGLFGTAADTLSELTDVDTSIINGSVGLLTGNEIFTYNVNDSEWQAVTSITVDVLTFEDNGTNANSWTISEDAGNNELLIQNGGVDAFRFTTANGIIVEGDTTFNGITYAWPGADGTPGQLLTTDSFGALTWSTVSGGAGSQNLWETISGDTGDTVADSVNDVLSIVGDNAGITTVATANTLTITNLITSLDSLSDVDLGTPPTGDDILKWNGASDFVAYTLVGMKTMAGNAGTPFDAAVIDDAFNIVGDGTIITTTVATDTMTIAIDFQAAADSFIALEDLSDMGASLAFKSPGDGIFWNGSTWETQPLAGAQATWTTILADAGSTTPAGEGTQLTIVGDPGTISTSITGDTIVITGLITDLSSLDNVNAGAPGDGDALTWDNGTSKWIATPIAAGSDQNLYQTISDGSTSEAASSSTDTLEIVGGTNVTASLNAVGPLKTLTISSGILESVIDDLADVEAPGPNGIGQILAWNGSQWAVENNTQLPFTYFTFSGGTGTTTPNSTFDDLAIIGGAGITTVATDDTITITNNIAVIDDLADVDTTGVAPGEILEWNGSLWIPVLNAGGVTIIDDLGDVDTTTIPPNPGEILEWNGSQWTPAANAGSTKDIYKTVTADTGTSDASGETDTLSIVGDGDLISTSNVAGTVTISTAALGEVSDDASPQLGGDLDVAGNSIVSVSNGDVTIAPNGTGNTDIDGMIHQGKNTAAVAASGNGTFDIYADTYIAAFIDYVFKTDAAGVQAGTLTVVTDGSTVSVSDTGAQLGTVSISFSAIINASNVEIDYQENNAAAGDLTWVARRMTI